MGLVAYGLVATTLTMAALGAYNWRQMVRHRVAGRPTVAALLPTNFRLTDRGRYHRNRALRFFSCAATIFVLSSLVASFMVPPLVNR